MREKFARLFRNLPIERKLLLASVIPLAALILLSMVTYRSVQVFSEDEEELQRIYQAQALSSEYMRLAVDLETGFRGYTLTNQDSFLHPYQTAREGILILGNMLEGLVSEDPSQRDMIAQVQALVEQMVRDKEALIQELKAGRQEGAEQYIEEGQGRSLMAQIRRGMSQFNALQRNLLNARLASVSLDQTSLLYVVLWGGALTLSLTVLALHLVARSITGPLISLARTVGGAPSGAVPAVPKLERQDEIGHLTQVMHAMSVQIKDHLSKLERSEGELRGVNQDLSASEAKYRSLVDHAPFGIFTTKGMTVLFSNRYNQMLAGLDPDDQMSPDTFRAAIHPADRQRVLAEFAQAVE
jgi:CHASE3 domain sensor protein